MHVDESFLQKLNFVVSVLFFAVSAVIWRFIKAPRFRDAPYTKIALLFWMSQWAIFAILYIVYPPPTSPVAVLIIADLQTVILLGFFFIFSRGDTPNLGQLVFDAGVIFFIFVAWDCGFDFVAPNWKRIWIFPSEVLSAAVLMLVAAAFLRRYRWPAVPFAGVMFFYVSLQIPVYEGRLLRGSVEPGWLLALACGKLIVGLFFFTLFFLTPREDAPLRWVPQRVAPDTGLSPFVLNTRRIAWDSSLAILAGLLIHFLGELASWMFSRLFIRQ